MIMEEIIFQGEKFTLNQCEDIFKWFDESSDGEFTHYYDKVIFNHSLTFIAAYSDNLNNYFFI